jgi:hypothetical protein
MLFVAMLIISVACFALASVPPPDPGTDLSEYVRQGLEAINRGNWKYLAALIIIGAVFLSKKYLVKVLPFLNHGKGAWTFTVVLSALAGLTTALIAGKVNTVLEGVSAFLAGAFLGAGATGLNKGAREWGLVATRNKAVPPPTPPDA